LYERGYAVDFIQIVEPQDVTLLAPTSQDALTLVTCYPFGSSPRSPLRYVVRASPLGPSRLAENPGARVATTEKSAMRFASALNYGSLPFVQPSQPVLPLLREVSGISTIPH
jgi:hypothetical protein